MTWFNETRKAMQHGDPVVTDLSRHLAKQAKYESYDMAKERLAERFYEEFMMTETFSSAIAYGYELIETTVATNDALNALFAALAAGDVDAAKTHADGIMTSAANRYADQEAIRVLSESYDGD